jgi:hypothetical protein
MFFDTSALKTSPARISVLGSGKMSWAPRWIATTTVPDGQGALAIVRPDTADVDPTSSSTRIEPPSPRWRDSRSVSDAWPEA